MINNYNQNLAQNSQTRSPNCVQKLAKLYLLHYLQGDPNQSLLFQMAITLKICISGPMLVKPQWVCEVIGYFLKNCKQITENWKKNPTASQTHFGFPMQYRVENAYF